jgi:hypothetical protein
MTQPPPANSAASAQMFIWWSLINLFLAVTAIGVTLWSLMQERDLRGELVRLTAARTCPQKVITSATPPIVDDTPVPAPPQDQAKSGYIGSSGTDDRRGHDPRARGAPRGQTRRPLRAVRLGSQQVLPPRTIHVVNLWATWCAPCLEELPDFKAMFARHPEWGDRSGSSRSCSRTPPPPRPPTATRSCPRPPTSSPTAAWATRSPPSSPPTSSAHLFKGNLPVTLVLDCNRRVRWAQFNQLQGGQFKELEGYIARFIDEIDDTSPGAWCTQEWPGNGRCEGNENTEKHHSLADCGPLKKTTDHGRRPTPSPPNSCRRPVAAPTCPEGNEVLPDGRCKPQLLNVVKHPSTSRRSDDPRHVRQRQVRRPRRQQRTAAKTAPARRP